MTQTFKFMLCIFYHHNKNIWKNALKLQILWIFSISLHPKIGTQIPLAFEETEKVASGLSKTLGFMDHRECGTRVPENSAGAWWVAMASWKLILEAWPLACLCAGVLSSYFLLVSRQMGSTVSKSVGKARRGYTAWRGGQRRLRPGGCYCDLST